MEIDWAGQIVWQHTDTNQHHDLHRLQNGNTLYLAREEVSAEETAQVRGGIPGTGVQQSELKGKMFGDVIREVSPGGELVWE